MAQGIGLEEELKEHLPLGITQPAAAMDHPGALGAGREGRPPRVLLEAAAEVPGEPGLVLLVGHDVSAASKRRVYAWLQQAAASIRRRALSMSRAPRGSFLAPSIEKPAAVAPSSCSGVPALFDGEEEKMLHETVLVAEQQRAGSR